MKLSNMNRASQLAEYRAQLLKLRHLSVSRILALGAEGADPIEIPLETTQYILDQLLELNAKQLGELGVTEIPTWRQPAKPPSTE